MTTEMEVCLIYKKLNYSSRPKVVDFFLGWNVTKTKTFFAKFCEIHKHKQPMWDRLVLMPDAPWGISQLLGAHSITHKSLWVATTTQHLASAPKGEGVVSSQFFTAVNHSDYSQ